MDRIAVLDVDSIAYAISSPSKATDDYGNFLRDDNGKFIYVDKTEQEIVDNSKSILTNIFKSCLADGYVGFIKGSNTGKFRYAIKSDYKHNRSSEQPKWWDFTSNYLKERFNIYNVDNYEVDDIVNIYRLKNTNSFTVACDKDLLNLPGVHYNWQKNVWQANTVEESELRFWKDMIEGQQGDGIKGIPKKGAVYANTLLQDCPTEDLPYKVLNAYIRLIPNGLAEYCKNYSCLKILDLNDNIDYNFEEITPQPIFNKGGEYEF